MAKLKMKYVRIYAHKDDRKPLLEYLQRLGVLDIENDDCDEHLELPDTSSSVAGFERSAAVASQALTVLDEFTPVKKGLLQSFAGRREISEEEFAASPKTAAKTLPKCHDIIDLNKKLGDIAAEKVRINTSLAAMEPWKPLDVPLTFSGTPTTAALIGTVAGEMTYEQLVSAVAEKAPGLAAHVEIIGVMPGQTAIFALFPRDMRAEGEQAFRELGFARPAATTSKLPSEKIKQYKERLALLEEQCAGTREDIAAFADLRGDIELTSDYYHMRADKYRAISKLEHTRSTFIVKGYIPEVQLEDFSSGLERQFSVVVEAEDADEEKAPVVLKNNKFAAPAQTITEMYALPLKSDIDPTPLTGFFYYLFFGMMLSDAGYGLLLWLGSWLITKKYNPEARMRRNLRLFMYCGISTTIWGVLFGSFFGDAIPVMAKALFNVEITLPAILRPMEGDAVLLLIISLIFGFIQIIASLVAKFWVIWKNGDKAGAFFDAGLWITTLLGLGLIATGIIAGPVVSKIGMITAIVSAVGLIATQGRSSKGIMKIFSGLASLYDVTGYVSDLLSFSRLMALGLTTAAMAAVFNMLSTMMGKGVVGVIAMLIIFPVTHAINFGLNALGSYVHTLRLQYVELFSKFYEGGGREFHPFALNSKYTRIKEEKSK